MQITSHLARETGVVSTTTRPPARPTSYPTEGHQSAMPLEPLVQYEKFRTGDLDIIRDVGGQVLVPHKVTCAGEVSPHARMNAAQLAHTTLAYLRYESEIRMAAPTTESMYFFTLPLSGRAEVCRGGSEVEASTPLRGAAFRAEDSGSIALDRNFTMLFVRVERCALERQLESMLGREIRSPIVFDFAMDLTSPALCTWVDSVRLLQSELERTFSAEKRTLITAQIEELVIAGLLTGQPHNYSDELHGHPRSTHPRVIRRAVELLEHQPDVAWTLRDLAGQLGISVRTLQDGFTRHVGLPPITYLREIRLAQAHADLAAGDAGTSVSATACKWGFTHLGRFAAAYRDRYGEHPSETLRASGTDTLQV